MKIKGKYMIVGNRNSGVACGKDQGLLVLFNAEACKN